MQHHNLRNLYAIYNILRIAAILLVFMLIGFEMVPLLSGSDTHYITQAAQQRTRSQIIARAALILLYEDSTSKPQALSDLQLTLPQFKAEYSVLLNNTDPQMQLIMQQLRIDYLSLQTGVEAIIANPSHSVIVEQEAVILAHDRPFLITMSSVLTILQQQIDSRNMQLFFIELGIDVVLIILMISMLFFTRVLIREAGLAAIEDEQLRADEAVKQVRDS